MQNGTMQMLRSIEGALGNGAKFDEVKLRFNFGKQLFFDCPSGGRVVTVNELLVRHSCFSMRVLHIFACICLHLRALACFCLHFPWDVEDRPLTRPHPSSSTPGAAAFNCFEFIGDQPQVLEVARGLL
jgi:hypothetical protein